MATTATSTCARFAELRERIREHMAALEAYQADYYERARAEFTVIDGGLSGNNSQDGII